MGDGGGGLGGDLLQEGLLAGVVESEEEDFEVFVWVYVAEGEQEQQAVEQPHDASRDKLGVARGVEGVVEV